MIAYSSRGIMIFTKSRCGHCNSNNISHPTNLVASTNEMLKHQYTIEIMKYTVTVTPPMNCYTVSIFWRLAELFGWLSHRSIFSDSLKITSKSAGTRRKYWAALQTWGVWEHTLPETFQIKGLGNAIPCAFLGVYSINEYEGKCFIEFVFIFPIFSVIGKVQC